MVANNKIDSNSTGLKYCEEASLGVTPSENDSTQTNWYTLEPNEYNDFGGEITTVARNPINDSRQRKKGVTTDVDATGGITSDITQTNMQDLLQGFLFADAREQMDTDPLSAAPDDVGTITITAATTGPDTYTAASGLDGFVADDIVFASGFTNSANNGIKVVTVAAAGVLTVAETLVAEASPPAAARLTSVGYEGAAGDLDVDVSGDLPRLTSAAGVLNGFGLVAGSWIYIGGDSAALAFTNAVNNGFKRIRSIDTAGGTYIEFDKSESDMVVEASTTETIHIFFARVIKNESAPASIVRRTYNLQRSLGKADTTDTYDQHEYIVGAVPSEFVLNLPTAEKMTADISFIGTDSTYRNGATQEKSTSTNNTEIALSEGDAFNTSSDIARIRLALVSDTDEAPVALFAYAQEITLTVDNNLSPNKAVGTLGAIDVTAGTFSVSGEITAYFADIAAVEAVRNNSNITIDFAVYQSNSGFIFDLPLLSLGDGRPNVEQDEPITVPLNMDAATGSAIDATNLDHTLMTCWFDYLPTLAETVF